MWAHRYVPVIRRSKNEDFWPVYRHTGTGAHVPAQRKKSMSMYRFFGTIGTDLNTWHTGTTLNNVPACRDIKPTEENNLDLEKLYVNMQIEVYVNLPAETANEFGFCAGFCAGLLTEASIRPDSKKFTYYDELWSIDNECEENRKIEEDYPTKNPEISSKKFDLMETKFSWTISTT